MRTRIEISVEHGLSPFVGRDQELGVLGIYFERAAKGHGQVVFVSGEAGIGKSRLLHEFRRSILDEGVTWLQGQCLSYGRNIPYRPIIDILKANFRLGEDENDSTIIERVDEKTAGWDEGAGATVGYLKYLLNVDPGDSAISAMDPMERRAGIYDGLRALLLQESRKNLLVVAVEDLHWIDEQSEEVLAALAEVVASARVLLVLNYRPGYTHSLGDRTYYSRLALGNLLPEDSSAMVEGVLRISSLPDKLQALINSKAEGNPFYIEEVTKSLIESEVLRETNGRYTLERPIEEVRVPDTLQEVILSRIDRLEQQAKETLQLASVIGREFTAILLGRISDLDAKIETVLGDLKALELIHQKAYFPELAYMFKHALTHDVAYSTLLREKRKALHRIIGATVEEIFADRLAEHYEVLAHHYSEGEKWDKALDYLVKAGDKAVESFANQEALSYYSQVLDVCEKLGESALPTSAAVAQRRGFINFTIGDFPNAIADFSHMLRAGRNLGDRHLEGMALAYHGIAALLGHEPKAAEDVLKAALAVADEGFEDVRFCASTFLAFVFMFYNRHAEIGPLLEVAGELAPKVDDPFAQSWWSWSAVAYSWAGRYDKALKHFTRWGESAEKSGSIFILLFTRWQEAVSNGGKGEYERALASLEDSYAIGERVGEVLTPVRIANTIGWIYGELQDLQRAMEWNMRGAEEAKEANFPDPEIESNARLNLGDNLMALSRLDEAEEQFQTVEQVIRNPRPQDHYMLWRYSQHLFHSYGELWLVRKDYEKAVAYADECIALAEESDSRKNIVKGRRLRGQVLLAQGKTAEAEKEISTALEVAKEIGNPPQLWKTHAALGDLREAQERPNDTRQAYSDALSIIEEVSAGLSDQSLRETFLNSDHVKNIRRNAEKDV